MNRPPHVEFTLQHGVTGSADGADATPASASEKPLKKPWATAWRPAMPNRSKHPPQRARQS